MGEPLSTRLSLGSDVLLTPRAPPSHAAVAEAYAPARRWRERRVLQLTLLVMLVTGVALMALGLSSPPPAPGQLHAGTRSVGSGLDPRLALGPPRYVLVLDCGSSGTRM
jgi:hypothetical protein